MAKDTKAALKQAVTLLGRFALHTCSDERGYRCGFCDAATDGFNATPRHQPDCIYPEAWRYLRQHDPDGPLWARALKIAVAKEAKETQR
jgi:hypothetical protein